MKYNKGDIVYIKPLSWYNHNKDENGEIHYKKGIFSLGMKIYCGRKTQIKNAYNEMYTTDFGHNIPIYDWMIDMYSTDRMMDAKRKDLVIQLDQNIIDKINLTIDSNEKYVNQGINPTMIETESLVKGLSPQDYSKSIDNNDRKKLKIIKRNIKKMKENENIKKLEVGSKIIGTDKTGIPMYFGFYEGRAGRGYYKVRVSNDKIVNCARIELYSEENILKSINKKFDAANVIAKRNKELEDKILKLIKEHNETYGTKLTAEIH